MRTYIAILCLMCSPLLRAAEADTNDAAGWLSRAVRHVESVWIDGRADAYVPFHAYHMRSNYTDEEIHEFRENTWGLGYGRSRYTDNGNWEGVYGMAFLDSNSDVQPVVGYAYQWMAGQAESLHAGIGYTALVTARARFAHYMPFPGVLPMASVGYDKVDLSGSYVPGSNEFGQIFFFWSRVAF